MFIESLKNTIRGAALKGRINKMRYFMASGFRSSPGVAERLLPTSSQFLKHMVGNALPK
jgi:hypothetical protein